LRQKETFHWPVVRCSGEFAPFLLVIIAQNQPKLAVSWGGSRLLAIFGAEFPNAKRRPIVPGKFRGALMIIGNSAKGL
jgi:hypothetical protein